MREAFGESLLTGNKRSLQALFTICLLSSHPQSIRSIPVPTMILSFTTLTTLSLWLLQATAAPTSAVPSHFPGDETPYRVVPEGSDVTAGGDVNGLNVLGTWLYGYTECRKRFGSGANGVIDRAYYDAWLISK